ncbi:MAG: hypothetical protein MHPSP_004806, partial [Paramarteilia canceri]
LNLKAMKILEQLEIDIDNNVLSILDSLNIEGRRSYYIKVIFIISSICYAFKLILPHETVCASFNSSNGVNTDFIETSCLLQEGKEVIAILICYRMFFLAL